jgi:periplasmic protein TonB
MDASPAASLREPGAVADGTGLPGAGPLRRRRSDGAATRNPERDRLISTLLVAALLHGVVLLGVSFRGDPPSDRGGEGLEVLLVSDELPEAQRNDDATYLSQRTQLGSGNRSDRRAAELPGGEPVPADAAPERRERAEAAEVDPLLATTAQRPTFAIQRLLTEAERDAAADAAARRPPNARDGRELALRGVTRDELYVTPDSRASKLAPYLDGWRRRVERIGTLNYPAVASAGDGTASPVVEVAVGSDGRLASAVILRTSGRPEIDAAALAILRLASPFDPFPPDLAREYRRLRFAYEWQFVGGRLSQSAVSVP